MSAYKRYDFHREPISDLAASSGSMSEMMRKLGFDPGNLHARKKLVTFCLDNDIPLPRGIRTKYVITDQEILRELSKKRVPGKRLRRILLAHDKSEECAMCGLGTIYNDRALTLVVDHWNGNPLDNSLDNLRFLCPNCHSQTDTYNGKNTYAYKTLEINECIRCSDVALGNDYCRACTPFVEDQERPSLTSMSSLLEEYGKVKNLNFLCEKYSVSREFIHIRVKEPERFNEDLSPKARDSRNVDARNQLPSQEDIIILNESLTLFEIAERFGVSKSTVARKKLLGDCLNSPLVYTLPDEDVLKAELEQKTVAQISGEYNIPRNVLDRYIKDLAIVTKRKRNPANVNNLPPSEELRKEVEETNYSVVARKYGVSPSSIRRKMGLIQ